MKRTLLIGPLPTPLTGLSIANQQALKVFSKTQKPHYINTSPREFSENLGKFNILSLLHFSLSYLKSYKIFFADKVYYTPGQTFLGVLKYAPFILLSKFLGKELIVHIHGNYVYEQYNQLNSFKKRIFHYLLSLSNKGIVLSEALTNNLTPFLPPDKIFVLPNFYNKSLTEQPLNKTFYKLKICFLSNLMNEKGIFYLIDALSELSAKGISFKASIAGHVEQSQRDKILDLMKQIKEVTYAGVVTGEAKRKLLHEANVFVLPTFYKMEGLPISIIEAMATGNVIISTNHAAIPDLVTEGENGFLVNKKSADQILEKLLFLANKPKKAKEISARNIVKAKNNFCSKKFSQRLLEIIHAEVRPT